MKANGSEFPARAGMNRIPSSALEMLYRVPRTRGDEPLVCDQVRRLGWEFPARAGMNREPSGAWLDLSRVPRTRGDEPAPDFEDVDERQSSPHARG